MAIGKKLVKELGKMFKGWDLLDIDANGSSRGLKTSYKNTNILL
jgi:hypothetical protein